MVSSSRVKTFFRFDVERHELGIVFLDRCGTGFDPALNYAILPGSNEDPFPTFVIRIPRNSRARQTSEVFETSEVLAHATARLFLRMRMRQLLSRLKQH